MASNSLYYIIFLIAVQDSPAFCAKKSKDGADFPRQSSASSPQTARSHASAMTALRSFFTALPRP
ncbi:MAG: hypothetical protein DBY36_03975 [Clostridiales bacterium]|nr:MAG: hypothetical protein DBY36_03975 [Clostridiales bacterium]